MKVAVIGSRNLEIKNIGRFLPRGTSEIISGGARGIDKCAAEFAHRNGIPCMEILPRYELYGKRAPLVRNEQILLRADCAVAIWDGKSRGTIHTANLCLRRGIPIKLFILRRPCQK